MLEWNQGSDRKLVRILQIGFSGTPLVRKD